jgi:outer membrane protein OmpA-like peptidoglycan-associated protein
MKKTRLLFLPVLFISIAFAPFFHLMALPGGSPASPPDLNADRTLKELKQYEAFIKKNAPGEDAFIKIQLTAKQYIQKRQMEKAADVFRHYRPLFRTMDNRFEEIIALLEAKEEGLVVTNLGSGINSSGNEWDPTPTPDGKLLYFSASHRPDCFGKTKDVFVSEYRNDKWQKAVNVGSSINTAYNDETVDNVSADGNTLFLSGNFQGSFGIGKFDVFSVEKTIHGWGTIRHLPNPINSEYNNEGGCLTSDGKTLLFCSDRPGGIGEFHRKRELFHNDRWGNTDIYVCLRTEKGWSEPINLGPTINTPYAEKSPFMHPDGKTLYFSSDGHYGLGGLDIFKAVRLNDSSWTEWSEPINLGKEINTAGDDKEFKVATSEKIAYFASYNQENGYGGMDIYSVTLPNTARPAPVVTVRGKITDAESRALEADIKWEDLSTGTSAGQLKSNPQDGTYFIALPLGTNYGYFAEKKGYYPTSRNINLKNRTESEDITENIILVSIDTMKEKPIAVRINNVFFDFNKSDLKPESFPELNRLAKILKENPKSMVEIDGHTDTIGSVAYNMDLSRQRTQAVVDYLVSVGCDTANLTSKGYGMSKPITSNETEEGRAQNRRVEFRFLKQ